MLLAACLDGKMLLVSLFVHFQPVWRVRCCCFRILLYPSDVTDGASDDVPDVNPVIDLLAEFDATPAIIPPPPAQWPADWLSKVLDGLQAQAQQDPKSNAYVQIMVQDECVRPVLERIDAEAVQYFSVHTRNAMGAFYLALLMAGVAAQDRMGLSPDAPVDEDNPAEKDIYMYVVLLLSILTIAEGDKFLQLGLHPVSSRELFEAMCNPRGMPACVAHFIADALGSVCNWTHVWSAEDGQPKFSWSVLPVVWCGVNHTPKRTKKSNGTDPMETFARAQGTANAAILGVLVQLPSSRAGRARLKMAAIGHVYGTGAEATLWSNEASDYDHGPQQLGALDSRIARLALWKWAHVFDRVQSEWWGSAQQKPPLDTTRQELRTQFEEAHHPDVERDTWDTWDTWTLLAQWYTLIWPGGDAEHYTEVMEDAEGLWTLTLLFGLLGIIIINAPAEPNWA